MKFKLHIKILQDSLQHVKYIIVMSSSQDIVYENMQLKCITTSQLQLLTSAYISSFDPKIPVCSTVDSDCHIIYLFFWPTEKITSPYLFGCFGFNSFLFSQLTLKKNNTRLPAFTFFFLI